MICNWVNARLSAYLDRELCGDEMIAMKDHMNQCESCAQAFEEERELKKLLSSISIPPLDPHFEDRLVASVFNALATEDPRPRFNRWGTAFAALLLATTMIPAANYFRLQHSTISPQRFETANTSPTKAASSRAPSTNQPVKDLQQDHEIIASSDPIAGPAVSLTVGFGRP